MSHTNDNAPIRRVVIACQGGASHTAFTAGALKQIFQDYSDQLSQSRPAADRYQIIGMSGTSGGSICAFLAWYGLITGGPQRASQLLEEFWGEDIAAKTFLEEVFLEKVGLQLLRMRTPPMGPILQVLTEWMNVPYSFNPQVLMDMWAAMHFGPLANFIAPRPEHVNMEDLFKKPDPQGQPLVDRNQVWYIGEAQRTLQRISKIISELNVLPDRAKNIDGRLREIQKLAQRVLEIIVKGQFQASIRDQLKDILEDIMGWQASDPDLTAGKKKFVQPLPTLLLGATDVLSGAFKAFDSRKGEVSIESVLASTTLPELWRARTIGNQIYWDGLYSENPPIRGFVELPDEPDEKPDEIWLIKIDPPEKLAEPEDNTAIADRRNETHGRSFVQPRGERDRKYEPVAGQIEGGFPPQVQGH